jgi:hypothetical protein
MVFLPLFCIVSQNHYKIHTKNILTKYELLFIIINIIISVDKFIEYCYQTGGFQYVQEILRLRVWRSF